MPEIDFDTDLERRARRQASFGNYWAAKCVSLLERISTLEAELVEANWLAAECECGDHG